MPTVSSGANSTTDSPKTTKSNPEVVNTNSGEQLQFDKWDYKADKGTLVRHHFAPRRRLFQPTGTQTCPVPIERIGQDRATHVQYVGGVSDRITDSWRDTADGTRALSAQWTGQTVFTVQHWLNNVLQIIGSHPKWIPLVTVRHGLRLTILKAITALVHGGRPTHFEQLKNDEKQKNFAPKMKKDNIFVTHGLRATYRGVCNTMMPCTQLCVRDFFEKTAPMHQHNSWYPAPKERALM